MQNTNNHRRTPSELEELCKFTNWLHRRVWTALAVIVAVCALIWNPYHLLTAALLLLVSRAEWDVKALD